MGREGRVTLIDLLCRWWMDHRLLRQTRHQRLLYLWCGGCANVASCGVWWGHEGRGGGGPGGDLLREGACFGRGPVGCVDA
jgi:hypothetical protein